jgi:hypothetical protein
MYTKQIVGFILFSIVMIIMSGCTSQAWYEGVKEGANNNCRNQPPSEVNRCLDKLNNKTYEEYEKERSGQK